MTTTIIIVSVILSLFLSVMIFVGVQIWLKINDFWKAVEDWQGSVKSVRYHAVRTKKAQP